MVDDLDDLDLDAVTCSMGREPFDHRGMTHEWSQSTDTVGIFLQLPPGISKARQLNVVIKRRSILVSIRGTEDAILIGRLYDEVKHEECQWELCYDNCTGSLVSIELLKVRRREWPSVLSPEGISAVSTPECAFSGKATFEPPAPAPIHTPLRVPVTGSTSPNSNTKALDEKSRAFEEFKNAAAFESKRQDQDGKRGLKVQASSDSEDEELTMDDADRDGGEEALLDAELASKSASLQQAVMQKLHVAVELKNEGNAMMKASRHSDALDKYSLGLEMLRVAESSLPIMAVRLAERSTSVLIDLHNNSAMAHWRLGDWPKVLERSESTLHLRPTNPKALFRKATALSKLDRTDEACTALSKLMEVDPANTDGASLLALLASKPTQVEQE